MKERIEITKKFSEALTAKNALETQIKNLSEDKAQLAKQGGDPEAVKNAQKKIKELESKLKDSDILAANSIKDMGKLTKAKEEVEAKLKSAQEQTKSVHCVILSWWK